MKKIFIILLSISLTSVLYAQTDEPGGVWTSFGVDKDLTKKINLNAEGELRTNGFNAAVERVTLGVGMDYSVLKNLKIGLGYEYLSVTDSYKWGTSPLTGLDSIRSWYQPRHRGYLQIAYKIKLGDDFSLSFRERGQSTFKDESQRIKQNGNINTARINPDFTWRNRIKLDYDIPKSKFTPSVSFESYCLLNDPALSAYFSKLRYTIALDYRINKKHSVELFGMLNKERSAYKNNSGSYILSGWGNSPVIGIGYSIQL